MPCKSQLNLELNGVKAALHGYDMSLKSGEGYGKEEPHVAHET